MQLLKEDRITINLELTLLLCIIQLQCYHVTMLPWYSSLPPAIQINKAKMSELRKNGFLKDLMF